MALLIENMEMPRKCIRCPVNVYGRCLVNDDKDVGKATADAVRDKDCPLVPAADVRPVVRGKWEEVEVKHAENIDLYPDLVTMRCGKCNRYHTTLFFYGNPTALMNFCPVCGADMREES